MIPDEYNRAFHELMSEIKGVSHYSDIKTGYVSSAAYVHLYGLLLAKLSDEDLKAVADRLKATKYFNVVIQAQMAAMNLEAKSRGLAWRI